MDQVNRTAECGMFIGNKEYWDKGYGEEAANLLLDYAFNILNLNSLMLRVYSFNRRAIRYYEKCGFRKIGKRRKAKILGNREYDVVYMDTLANELKESATDKILGR
jgi:RimJ/RimL family protein N-acetyltransferase